MDSDWVMGAGWEECYTKHADGLLRFAASQVGSSDAADVVSTALVGVLGRGTEGVVDPRSYLYRAVANAAANHWRSLGRRRRRDVWLVLPSSVEDELPDPHADSVVRALAALSVQQRAVVHLAYWEDLSSSMIAARLGITDGTVRRQLARARAKLRRGLRTDD